MQRPSVLSFVVIVVVTTVASPNSSTSKAAVAAAFAVPVVLTRQRVPSTIFLAGIVRRSHNLQRRMMEDDDDDDVYADVDLSNFDVDAVIAAHEAASSKKAAAAASSSSNDIMNASPAGTEEEDDDDNVETTTLSSSSSLLSPSKRRKVSVSPAPPAPPPPHNIAATAAAEATAEDTTTNDDIDDIARTRKAAAVSLKNTLLDTFGYTDFRPGQLQVLQHLIYDKSDVAVYWATGQGKSLCYQIPALFKSNNNNNLINNMVVVVSPLISLMQDQCHKLNGLLAISSSTYDEPIAAFLGSAQLDANVERNALQGKYKILYVTPEKMTQDAFLDQLARLHSSSNSSSGTKICLIAVDEAHCVRYVFFCDDAGYMYTFLSHDVMVACYNSRSLLFLLCLFFIKKVLILLHLFYNILQLEKK
jgi:DEAD/DEAH box helicase